MYDCEAGSDYSDMEVEASKVALTVPDGLVEGDTEEITPACVRACVRACGLAPLVTLCVRARVRARVCRLERGRCVPTVGRPKKCWHAGMSTT